MQVLDLVISGEALEKIINGEKNVEYLEYNDYYIPRLCERDENGEPVSFKPYDAVHFRAGVSADARDATFRIKNIEIVDWLDTAGNPLQTDFVIYLGKRVEEEVRQGSA